MVLDYSFTKDQRLRSSKDIRWVLEGGQKYTSASLILFLKRTEDERVKVGFIVSKKVGPAVLRNRVKRLMREAFRSQKAIFEKGLWMIFLAKTEVKEWNQKRVLEEMIQLAQRIKP